MTTSKKPKDKAPPKRGRPPIQGEAMKRYQVVLDEGTAEGLKSLDDGNLSGGIRKAWKKINKKS